MIKLSDINATYIYIYICIHNICVSWTTGFNLWLRKGWKKVGETTQPEKNIHKQESSTAPPEKLSVEVKWNCSNKNADRSERKASGFRIMNSELILPPMIPEPKKNKNAWSKTSPEMSWISTWESDQDAEQSLETFFHLSRLRDNVKERGGGKAIRCAVGSINSHYFHIILLMEEIL